MFLRKDRIARDSIAGEGEGSSPIFRARDRALQPRHVSGKFPFMNKRMAFAAALAFMAALAISPALAQRRNAAPVSIVASVGHSEWCRAGTVRLALGTGRYTVTAPPNWRACRRPPWPGLTRTSVLPAADLMTVRDAWERVEAEGLQRPNCRNGGRPETIYVSNGGARTLRVTLHRRVFLPPRDENCWSEAATQLHDVMERLFNPRRR